MSISIVSTNILLILKSKKKLTKHIFISSKIEEHCFFFNIREDYISFVIKKKRSKQQQKINDFKSQHVKLEGATILASGDWAAVNHTPHPPYLAFVKLEGATILASDDGAAIIPAPT